MHDPMVVAHEIPSPIPRRDKWSEKADAKRYGRWGLYRRRRTNPENLGQPVYRWWRPAGWHLRIAGRSYRSRTLATIWHVEPGGKDALSVCSQWKDGKRTRAWKWHVRHWKLQVHALQDLRARLFDRCEECGRKGRPNFGHSWDGDRLGWWKFRSRKGLYHHECSSLVFMRRQAEERDALIRHLFAAVRVLRDESEVEALTWLCDSRNDALTFAERRRLWMLLGYERDESYGLIKREVSGA